MILSTLKALHNILETVLSPFSKALSDNSASLELSQVITSNEPQGIECRRHLAKIFSLLPPVVDLVQILFSRDQVQNTQAIVYQAIYIALSGSLLQAPQNLSERQLKKNSSHNPLHSAFEILNAGNGLKSLTSSSSSLLNKVRSASFLFLIIF